MPTAPESSIERCVYPESEFGGFTRLDGTIQFYARVRALLRPESTVLDIGCGRGRAAEDDCEFRRSLRDLREDGRRVIGIDVDPNARANPTIDEFALITSLRHWPIDDGAIDLAFCDYVIEHVDDPKTFFAEWRRVLKPGGYACLRTPNATSYIAVISRIIPNRFHGKVVGFSHADRKSEDVFPTYYCCNTRRKLMKLFRSYGFQGCIYNVESEPNYLRFSRIAYRLGAIVHRYLPQTFQSTLLGFARKIA
jgi:SAM-dependent methyltransferase